jgi:hypothetical protein
MMLRRKKQKASPGKGRLFYALLTEGCNVSVLCSAGRRPVGKAERFSIAALPRETKTGKAARSTALPVFILICEIL